VLTNQTAGDVPTGIVGDDLLGGSGDADGIRLAPYATAVVRADRPAPCRR
jgi:hypothetical protein